MPKHAHASLKGLGSCRGGTGCTPAKLPTHKHLSVVDELTSPFASDQIAGTRNLLSITHKSLVWSEGLPAEGEVEHSPRASPDHFGSRRTVAFAVIVAAKGRKDRDEL